VSVDKILGGLLGGGSGGGGGGDLVGSILGQLTGARSTSPSGGGGLNPALLMTLLPIVLKLLQGGGLQKILGGMRAQGLTSQADSWVGTGENQPVTGAQVRQAVGTDEVARVAQEAGVSEDEAADGIAQLLPQLVDGASPDGQLEPQESVDSVFDQLRKSAAAQ
jgi:uncharacterized protein YidB (DUF937 family)